VGIISDELVVIAVADGKPFTCCSIQPLYISTYNRIFIMTSTQQRAALQRQIWQIANDVRGSVDGWDFKQYVLGTLFYRFISENFTSYVEADDESIH